MKNNLPELDAGFLKWYSKYFGTKVPKPTTPNSKKTVDRALNTYTLTRKSLTLISVMQQ